MQASDKYPFSIRLLHWLIALFIIALLTVGFVMTGMDKADPLRGTLYGLHKSFGVTVLMLAVLRLSLRLKLGTPPLPAVIPALERTLAGLGHGTLYAFMFLMPISGYVMSTSYGLPVKWFGLALPRLVDVDKARGALAADIHYFAAYALIGLLAAHVGAVAFHYFRQRVNLLRRML